MTDLYFARPLIIIFRKHREQPLRHHVTSVEMHESLLGLFVAI